jgi:flavodoxin
MGVIMIKIPIFYFSATGNTKYCTQIVQKGFEDIYTKLGIDLIEIKTVKNLPYPNQTIDYPPIGIAFPIYEFIIPRIMHFV